MELTIPKKNKNAPMLNYGAFFHSYSEIQLFLIDYFTSHVSPPLNNASKSASPCVSLAC